MKNVTLSMPEELLERARKYALEKGTTLNQMIRDLLAEEINEDRTALVEEMRTHYGKIKGPFKPLSRDEIYDR